MKKCIGILIVIAWAYQAIPMWFIGIPQMLMDDLPMGLGYAVGNILGLVLGIWLIKSKKKIKTIEVRDNA